ncbi:MAG: hypothetical protein COA99_08735 [Moraxellaceae bacterium]|nr:MAG: hypothetical protein COA99_08735 [Moraxellaceae bacterium]
MFTHHFERFKKTNCAPHFGIFALTVFLVSSLSGCKSESELVVDDMPDSENLLFTPEGRLFVSGGKNVFEVIKNDQGKFYKLDTFHDKCFVNGIIQRADYVYGVCSKMNFGDFLKSYLIAGKIEDLPDSVSDVTIDGDPHPTIEMKIIGALSGLGIPNGMEVDEFGNLYIADSGTSNIFKVHMANPEEIESIELWASKIVFFVNGLEWVDDVLYFTGIRRGTTTAIMGKIELNDDGGVGEVTELFERKNTVLDDLVAYKGGVIITDYFKGSLVFWKNGKLQAETMKDMFYAPSAVRPTQPPMFNQNALLVTEKGISFNGNVKYGNKLGLFYPDF